MTSPQRYARYIQKQLAQKLIAFRVIWCENCGWRTEVADSSTRKKAKRAAGAHEKAFPGHVCRVSVEYVRTEKA